MKVMIVGGGGREHALAWKCAQCARVERVFVAPGNAGTAREPKVHNIDIAAGDIEELLRFAARERVDLTIVGPEAPLVAGIVDRFADEGQACFGPRRAAARLEGSKAYTKAFLQRHGIPTAGYAAFTATDFDPDFVRAQRLPVVVKADGLAAGKGVVICETHEAALEAAQRMLSGCFGTAGSTIVIEEFLRRGGSELHRGARTTSRSMPLATSQDHKRRDDGDLGPNTGGMGAYSPAPIVTPALHARIMREVINPTLRGFAATAAVHRIPVRGSDDRRRRHTERARVQLPARRPETQPILMRLQSDLLELCEAAVAAILDRVEAAGTRVPRSGW